MATCSKCGAQLPENTFTCPNCGTPNVSVEGADYTAQYDTNDIQQNKLMAVLAYIGFLFLVPLLAAPQSPYARFHTNQGLVLFIVEAILGTVASICLLIPFLGGIVGGIVSAVASLLSFIFMILGIVNAATGKVKELPIIGKIRIIK